MNKQSLKKKKSHLVRLKKNRFFKKSVSAPVKKSEKPSKFPKIYRKINEQLSKQLKKITKQIIIAWISVTLLVAVVFVSFDLSSTLNQKQKLVKERQKIISQIQFWQGVVNKYKGYRDAYFTLAVLEYRLGEYAKAKNYLNQALALDPNFEKGRELEKLLKEK